MDTVKTVLLKVSIVFARVGCQSLKRQIFISIREILAESNVSMYRMG